MFVDSNSFHIQIQITEKNINDITGGPKKYTNYSKVMIKEGLLGTRRYLSRGGGGGREGVRGFWGHCMVIRRNEGIRGRIGGGRYRKLTAKEGGPLLGLLLTIDSCFNKLVMHIIRGHCS